MSKAKQAVVDQIYDVLCRQRFNDFYNGQFSDHISDERDKQKADEKQVKEYIANLFNVNKIVDAAK